MPNTFDFSTALTLLKEGKLIRRNSWKEAFIFMAGPATIPIEEIKHDSLQHAMAANLNDDLRDVGNVRMYFEKQSRMISGWTPNTIDLLSSDWEIYDPLPAAWEHTQILLEQALKTEGLDAEKLTLALMHACFMLSIPAEVVASASDDAVGEIKLGGKYAGVHIQFGDDHYMVSGDAADDDDSNQQVFKFVNGKGRLLDEIKEAMREAEIEPSTRKFYRTLVELTVLSEEPIPEGLEIDEIVRRANDDDYVGAAAKMTSTELTAVEVVDALYAAGSEPGFFQLTPEGRDAD